MSDIPKGLLKSLYLVCKKPGRFIQFKLDKYGNIIPVFIENDKIILSDTLLKSFTYAKTVKEFALVLSKRFSFDAKDLSLALSGQLDYIED